MKMSLITVPGQLALIDVHDLSKRSWVLPLFSSFLMRKSCLVFVVCFFFLPQVGPLLADFLILSMKL